MKRIVSVLVVWAIALGSTAPGAVQKRPDFSGTWVEDESQRKSPYDKVSGDTGVKPIGGPPPPLTITQTPERLTIERTRGTQTTRFVHDFDGRENKNHTGAQIHTTRSRWEGSRLITEGSIYQVTSQGETSWTLKEARWLTARGELAVEVTQIDEDNQAGTVLRIFRKR
jgi:hypothetical protein